MLILFDEDVLIIDVFDDDLVVALLVDPADDGFDGGIALDEYTCIVGGQWVILGTASFYCLTLHGSRHIDGLEVMFLLMGK